MPLMLISTLKFPCMMLLWCHLAIWPSFYGGDASDEAIAKLHRADWGMPAPRLRAIFHLWAPVPRACNDPQQSVELWTNLYQPPAAWVRNAELEDLQDAICQQENCWIVLLWGMSQIIDLQINLKWQLAFQFIFVLVYNCTSLERERFWFKKMTFQLRWYCSKNLITKGNKIVFHKYFLLFRGGHNHHHHHHQVPEGRFSIPSRRYYRRHYRENQRLRRLLQEPQIRFNSANQWKVWKNKEKL